MGGYIIRLDNLKMHVQEHSIAVRGKSRTTFLFPAELSDSLAYFADYTNILSNLPHISLTESYPGDRFRLVYKTLELGLYRVEITCDVRAFTEKHPSGERMIFESINNNKPVKSGASLHSLSGQGNYQSESIFEARGRETMVHFSLQLFADLPCPWGLLIVPSQARNRIAHSITNYRIHEITDGFIQNSLLQYQEVADRRR